MSYNRSIFHDLSYVRKDHITPDRGENHDNRVFAPGRVKFPYLSKINKSIYIAILSSSSGAPNAALTIIQY
jgi:hypothetical protein